MPGFVPAPPDRLDDATALTLPAAPPAPPRPSIPWLASAVPVVGALGFWALTGSVFALWFAVLGPVIAVAGVLDGARVSRRERREAEERAGGARRVVAERVAARHDEERAAWWAQHPDAGGFAQRPDQIWRPVPGRHDRIVIGSGVVASGVRVGGGDGDADAELQRAARRVADAPVLATLSHGVAVVGPPVVRTAVARALVLQAVCGAPPGTLELRPDADAEQWTALVPHVGRAAGFRLAWGAGRAAVPEADALVLELPPGAAVPPECATVLELTGLRGARAHIDGVEYEVDVEAVGREQAEIVAAELRARAQESGDELGEVALAALRPLARERCRTGLAAAVAVAAGEPHTIDLVADGPHAVVTGTTGSGKSELLVSWVLAMCTRYTTADVAFLLVDFKGGTAFDPLAAVPHVTGVVTDLDSGGARRAVESLRAEVRTREAALAAADARDIAAIEMPRLVVVVDEFAALRETHPDLEALFGDLAARGRALGIHLVLGTQRAAGVLRDSLLANCGLRISLRVSDPHDSRTVLGVPDAAELPGDRDARGFALVRRASDARPTRVRIARSGPSDVAAAIAGAGERPRAPWLPPLPRTLDLDALPTARAGAIVLGLADDPDRQAQETAVLAPEARGLLVVGGAGSGKTTALHTAAAQVGRRMFVGPDPEQAWDALCAVMLESPAAGTLVVLDDLDALSSRLPDEYARAAAAAIEQLVRDAGRRGLRILASAQRLTGIAGRVAELFPRRLLMPIAGRPEWVAAGGAPAQHPLADRPGRGVLDGRVVQVAQTAASGAAMPAATVPLWHPPLGLSGAILPRHTRDALTAWERAGVRVRSLEDTASDLVAPIDAATVLVGDAEQWLGRARVLDRLRDAHEIVVDASCARDLRMLTGERDLPPYLAPLTGRAWSYAPGRLPRRVTLVPAA